jgi:hypothetical protein
MSNRYTYAGCRPDDPRSYIEQRKALDAERRAQDPCKCSAFPNCWLAASDDRHGKRSSYNRGCRCDDCKRAVSVKGREARQRRREEREAAYQDEWVHDTPELLIEGRNRLAELGIRYNDDEIPGFLEEVDHFHPVEVDSEAPDDLLSRNAAYLKQMGYQKWGPPTNSDTTS